MKTAGAYLYSQKKSLIGRFWKTVSRRFPQILFEGMEMGYNFFQKSALKKILETEKIDFIYERYAFFLWVTAGLSKRYGMPLVLEVNEVEDPTAGIQEMARPNTVPIPVPPK